MIGFVFLFLFHISFFIFCVSFSLILYRYAISTTDIKSENPALTKQFIRFVFHRFCSFVKWFNAIGYSSNLPDSKL
jgi:hypothetical protein